jgi:two-component system, cell cycle sensor histidine kinase and response regulator CckA
MAAAGPINTVRFEFREAMEVPKLSTTAPRSAIVTYAAPFLATILATLLRMALRPIVGAAVPFVSYFLAILLLAWYSGFRAAALGILLSAIAGTYFFISPATTSPFLVVTRTDRVAIFGFVFLSLAAAFLLDLQRKTLARLEQEVVRRRAAEDAEKRQRQWFEVTLASIGDAVIATDSEGKVTFMNKMASDLTEWDVSQALGLPLGAVFHIVNEQTGAAAESPTDKVIKEGISVGLANHTLLVSRGGRRIPLDDSAAPIKRDNSILGAVLVFRDVTERRSAQQQIENSERRYRLLFDNNPQPMWVYDRNSLEFLAVNNAAVRQYGYSAEEFLRMTLKDIRPAEETALLEDVCQSALTLHRDGPWRHRKRDGTTVTVEITAHPMQFEGRNACLVLASDITERRKLEEQFHQAQRLESVGRLAGAVAHDFNNLLTVINGYTEITFDGLPADSHLAQRLGEVRAAGRRAAELTQQLLAFSRKQVVQPTVLNVNSVVTNIENMLRRLIGEDIVLVTILAPDVSNVKADVGQVEQMIMNLAVNARDAMPTGGVLTIETANVILDETQRAANPDLSPEAYVILSMTDTGTGMTPEIRRRIFEPFYTTKPKGLGTGLGLATVYAMVQQTGGLISVDTEPGRGACFKIYLPQTDDPIMGSGLMVESDLHGNETILVVEDQDEVRRLLEVALTEYGYKVLSVAGGEEALALLRSFDGVIHLLLADIVMPGMNGRELANQVALERADLRVLFMSGYPQETITHRGVLDQGLDYIQKPFTPHSLAKKVREVLGRC